MTTDFQSKISGQKNPCYQKKEYFGERKKYVCKNTYSLLKLCELYGQKDNQMM